jgi:hypothetical protein
VNKFSIDSNNNKQYTKCYFNKIEKQEEEEAGET